MNVRRFRFVTADGAIRLLRLLCVCVAVLALPYTAEGRQLGKPSPQVLIGVNFTTINVEPTLGLDVDWRAGLAAGAGVSVPLGRTAKVAFLPEVLFQQKGAAFPATGEDLRLNYIEVTSGVQLDVFPAVAGDHKILMQIAPTFAWNLTASRDANGDVTDVKDSIEPFDAGLLIGLSTAVVKGKLDVGARFEFGLRRVFRADDSKNRSLLIFVTPHLFKN